MKISLKKILKSFQYSFNGIKIHSQQHNFVVMLISAFFVILLGFIFQISYFEWLILILIISLILCLETINTTLEKTWDYLEPNFSDKIKMFKDLMAGGVAIAIFTSIIIGLMIFLPKIIDFLLKIYIFFSQKKLLFY